MEAGVKVITKSIVQKWKTDNGYREILRSEKTWSDIVRGPDCSGEERRMLSITATSYDSAALSVVRYLFDGKLDFGYP
jgi:hypothetical protein